MATANRQPISQFRGLLQWNVTALTTADTGTDGTGANVQLICAADSTNGSRIVRLRGMHLGTNVATILRIFLNNGLTPATAANNCYLCDFTCAANTISQVAASVPAFDASGSPFAFVLDPGFRLYGSVGTTIASGIRVFADLGAY